MNGEIAASAGDPDHVAVIRGKGYAAIRKVADNGNKLLRIYDYRSVAVRCDGALCLNTLFEIVAAHGELLPAKVHQKTFKRGKRRFVGSGARCRDEKRKQVFFVGSEFDGHERPPLVPLYAPFPGEKRIIN